MSDKYTKMLEDIRSSYPPSNFDRVTYPGLAWDRIITIEGFDRWLSAHDAETRIAALEEAAVIAEALDFGPAAPFSLASAHKWGAKQAAERIRAAKGGQ